MSPAPGTRSPRLSLSQVADTGLYSCEVSNAAGEAVRAFALTVQGKQAGDRPASVASGPSAVCGAATHGKGSGCTEVGVLRVQGTGLELEGARSEQDLLWGAQWKDRPSELWVRRP